MHAYVLLIIATVTSILALVDDKMANFILAVTLFAAFIVNANVCCYASECTLSNIEILSQFIDERINATVSTLVAEFTATIEESIAASVNATLNAFSATVDDKISIAESDAATIDERIATVGAKVGAHGTSISNLLSQPGITKYNYVGSSSP